MRKRFSKRFLRGFRFSNVVLLKRTTFENLWKTSKRFLKGSRSPEVFQRFFRGFRSTFFVYFRCESWGNGNRTFLGFLGKPDCRAGFQNMYNQEYEFHKSTTANIAENRITSNWGGTRNTITDSHTLHQ